MDTWEGAAEQQYRGFRIRFIVTGQLKADLLLYKSDITPLEEGLPNFPLAMHTEHGSWARGTPEAIETAEFHVSKQKIDLILGRKS